jgi:hypothetical protein
MANFSVNDFKKNLTYGGARNTLFQVQLFAPPGVPGLSLIKVPCLTRSAAIPEATVGLIEIPYFGRKVKMAGDREFQPWQVTIINDEDFAIRNAMETWSNAINQFRGNTRLSGASALSYKADAVVTQFDKQGKALRTYRFEGLYPQTISSIQLDWSDINRIEDFQVSFEYDNWTVDASGGNTATPGNQG